MISGGSAGPPKKLTANGRVRRKRRNSGSFATRWMQKRPEGSPRAPRPSRLSEIHGW
ncbi:hypothetical protein SAMN05444161_8729 [Rhizobiales bacterium GAS191]|nr:hypothetical protein SAMN05444161_8729 [Rhizobiales bacterium GAS191]